MTRFYAVLLAAVVLACPARAALSPNLLPYGDFEDIAGVKQPGPTPRTQAEIDQSLTPLNETHFHIGGVAGIEPNPANQIIPAGTPFTDLGRWFAPFGGITVFDDPRAAFTNGDTVAGINRSEDPLRPGNHVLEGAGFRPWADVIVQAPVTMQAGEARLNFEYYFHYWDAVNLDATPQLLQPIIHGINAADLPTPQDRWSAWNGDNWENENPVGDGWSFNDNWVKVYTGADFNSQWHDADILGEPDEPYVPDQGDAWHTYSSGVTEIQPTGWVIQPGEGEDGSTLYYDGTFNLTQTYDYFLITFRMVTYSEGHEYFWLWGGKPTDAMSVAIDNVSFQVTVEDSLPEPVPGDFNFSGNVDTEDINPFILALTLPDDWCDWGRAILGESLTDQQIIDYADPNGDGMINTEDINPFIIILTNSGQSAIIPEPAALGLLVVASVGLLHRRDRQPRI